MENELVLGIGYDTLLKAQAPSFQTCFLEVDAIICFSRLKESVSTFERRPSYIRTYYSCIIIYVNTAVLV